MNHPSNRAERLRIKNEKELQKKAASKGGRKKIVLERIKEQEADDDIRLSTL